MEFVQRLLVAAAAFPPAAVDDGPHFVSKIGNKQYMDTSGRILAHNIVDYTQRLMTIEIAHVISVSYFIRVMLSVQF